MNNCARIRSGSNTPARSALVLGLGLLLAGVLAGGVSAASGPPPFTPQAAEFELVRLLNIERTRAGLPTLAVDAFLAQRARDGNIPCPDDPTKVMAGRAGDLAANWSPYGSVDPHLLRLCPTQHIFGPMWSLWGYTGAMGEIIAWNGGYSMNPMSYPSDCGVEGITGPCYDTTPATVSVAATGWMEEPGHRAIVLGDYDRFGCGAATGADGSHFYVCIFSLGGGTASPDPSPDPTASPDPSASPDPTPTPTPVPDETAPTVTSLSAPTVLTTTNRSLVATWTASDDQAIAGYVAWIRKGSGAWSEQPAQTGTTRTFKNLSPGTWHIGVRAHDDAGNWSDFRQTTILVPTDDRAWAFSSGSTRRTGSSYLNGTDTRTSRPGSKMTIRFTGSSFVLVGTTARNYGRLRVVIDGKAYTVDEGYYLGSRATSAHFRVVLLNQALINKAHTVVITCLGTSGRPTIDLDGAAWRS